MKKKDNEARASITMLLIGEPTKSRQRRRKNVPDAELDAWLAARIDEEDGKELDREAIIKDMGKKLKCTRELARAAWVRRFPAPEGKQHHGGRGKRLR